MRQDKYRLKSFALFLVLILSLPAPVPADPSSGPPKSFLWKCTSESGTVYLLGSIHFGKPEMYPLAESIMQAFEQSSMLYLEADTQAADPSALQQKMIMLGQYPPGQTVVNDLPKDLLDLTFRSLQQMGLPVDSFAGFRPWFIAFQLSAMKLMQLGWSPQYGLDMHFTRLAREQGKPIGELEGIDFQLDLLSGLSSNEQQMFLRYTLKTLDQAAERLNRLIPVWKRGDAEALQKEIFSEELLDPALEPFYEKFFWRRNEVMASKVAVMLSEGRTVFVVVGAGHLIGPKGLVDLLTKKGIQVEQI